MDKYKILVTPSWERNTKFIFGVSAWVRITAAISW